MNELNIQEKTQLETFSAQRDALLFEISGLKSERDILQKKNIEVAISSGEIEKRINQNIGRLKEMDEKEKEFANKVSDDIFILSNKKTKLESQVSSYERLIEVLKSKHELLSKSIKDSSEVYKIVFDRTGALGQVIDHVTRVSTQNLNDSNEMEEKIRKWKRLYKEIFKVTISGEVFIFRVLNVGELIKIQTLVQQNKIEEVDQFIYNAVLYPENFNCDTTEAVLSEKLSEYIVEKSSVYSSDGVKLLIKEARIKVANEFNNDFTQWKIAIVKTFPGYKFSDLDDLSPREFFYLLALAEKLTNTSLVNDGSQIKNQRRTRPKPEERTVGDIPVVDGKKFMNRSELEQIAADESTNVLREHFNQFRKK